MKQQPEKNGSSIERNIVVNGAYFHVKSVFGNKITLEKALANIAKRKLSKPNKNRKH